MSIAGEKANSNPEAIHCQHQLDKMRLPSVMAGRLKPAPVWISVRQRYQRRGAKAMTAKGKILDRLLLAESGRHVEHSPA
jgi:hypothetical protein